MRNTTANISTSGTGTVRGLWTKISWSSIFAGLVVAVIMQFLLSLLGLGIGMAAIQPTQQNNPLEGVGTGAVIWWVLTVLISVFTGGFVAGRWAGAIKTSGRAFHGVLTWGLFTILSFYFLTTTVGGIIGGVGNILGSTLSMAGSGLAQSGALSNDQNFGGTTGSGGPIGNIREVANAFERYMQTGSEEDRRALAQEISQRTGMTTQEADAEIERLEQQYGGIREDAEYKAREIGEDASNAVAKAAFITFIALVLGAGAAALGGGLAKRDIETAIPVDATNA
jgi:hypothetical protein